MAFLAFWASHWQNWTITACILAFAIAVASVLHYIIFLFLKRAAQDPKRTLDYSVYHHGKGPGRWILYCFAILIALPTLPIPQSVEHPAQHVFGLAAIAAVAWILILFTEVFSDIMAARYRVDVSDNLSARKIQTRTRVLRRITQLMIIVLTIGIMLLTIPHVRAIGTSLLASAGVAALVVGMAMKPTLSNVIAGIQIAITQPMRLDDAVIVENDWGWIEEINITYVVIRTWDWRRWVIPISYFVENPFQNWTKQTAQLIGSVHLFVDYTAPLEDMRQEMNRLLKATEKWRGEVVVLQVVEATEHAMQLRILADAKDAGTAWDLRCYVREGLIKFLQKNYPESLPRTRTDIDKFPVQQGGIPERVNVP